MPENKTPLIGIAGGIASGKSFVAEQFERLGAAVISADTAAHEVLEWEDVKRAAKERWGDAIFTADGQIDRAALARIVFGSEGQQEREFLEKLTHPRIGQVIRRRLDELARRPSAAAIVLEVPLLFESGWNKFCDKTVFVDAPRATRLARAAARGWTPEEFDRREAAQLSVEAKRQQSDFVIDNSASAESTRQQVERFWQSLVGSQRA